MSRLVLQDVINKAHSSTEEHVNLVAAHSVPKAMSLKEIQEATEKDPTLNEVIKAMDQGWSIKVTEKLLAYSKVRNELCIVQGLVLRGNQIVIPIKLKAHNHHFWPMF